MGVRHDQPRRGHGAYEFEGVEILCAKQRGAFDLHQHVDRYGLRVLWQIGQLLQHGGAIPAALAQSEDAATADVDLLLADAGQGVQPILIGAGGDHLAIELRGGVQVVIVVVQPGLLEFSGLLVGQHAQGEAGLHAEVMHGADHLDDVIQIFIRGVAPGGAHAEAACPLLFCDIGCFDHILHRQQLLRFQLGAVFAALRAVTAILGAGAGLDADQAGGLYCIGIKVCPVCALGLKQQVVEGLIQ